MKSPLCPESLPQGAFDAQTLREATTLPACAYTDPAFHDFEQAAAFSNTWQLIGRGDQLAHAGDHVVASIVGKPILAVRGDDAVLRGFFNVCKHRAGPLALADGNARRLRCKYHGWTYGLDGRLKSAHEMEEADGFDPACIGLDPVPVALWEGLVFAAVAEPVVSLEQVMENIREHIQPIELSGMRFDDRVEYRVACNWKLYVENYLEGYHLPHVHPGLNQLLDYRQYETKLSRWHSCQTSPLNSSQGPYGEGSAYYYFVWPNLMLNVLPDRLQVNRVIPISQRECTVIFDYFYTDTQSAEAQRMIGEDLRFSDEVQQEDIAICERVQVGLESGAYRPGRLSPKREAGVHHFQELLRAAWRQAKAVQGRSRTAARQASG